MTLLTGRRLPEAVSVVLCRVGGVSDFQPPTLLVVDGHSLAFRAFFALPTASFSTGDGQHTNAIHGFLSMLLRLLQDERPTHLAVAFDVSRVSFRTREYADYKATRAETPSEFKGQIPLLQDALRAMGICVIEKPDYEADDIVATLATRGSDAGYRVLAVSGDRDTLQLVTDTITVLYPSVQGVSQLKRYDPAAVRERYGVTPEQYPEIAALVGETSDNLPGIPKVGEKTAVKWITTYGSLEALLARADEVPGVVGENLRRDRDNAVRNRRLNALVRDLELPVSLDDLARGPINLETVRPIFDRLEFRSLLERLRKLGREGILDVRMGEVETVADSRTIARAPRAETLGGAALEAWLAKAQRSAPEGVGIAFSPGNDHFTAVGLATADAAVEVEWRPGHPDFAPLAAWLASDAPKLLSDAKPVLRTLAAAEIPWAGLAADPLLCAAILDPVTPERTLADCVMRRLGEHLPQPDPSLLIADEEPPKLADLAWVTARLTAVQREALSAGEAGLLQTVELPLVPVLADMERHGVAIDRGELTALATELGARTTALASEAYAVIGRTVNLGSPKQLQEVLFGELGMPMTRATKTGYSTDAEALLDLMERHPHPFLELLLEHRDATKLLQMVETLSRAVGVDDHRIHTTYGQIGAATGRMSSNDPNLQNIPIRNEESRRMRRAFVAGPGFTDLLTADYSQIEMRIMAHLSEDTGLIEAFQAGEDLHRFVGSRVFGVAPEQVTSEMRAKVKAMSYGLAYGLGAFGLARQLRIERSEAQQLMADYFDRFGGVRDYLRGVVAKARVDGYTETLFGRRRPFPDLNSPNRVHRENAERAALNSPIQGTAADIVKVAMSGIAADLAAEGLRSRMLLQVHDELVFEVAPGESDALEHLVRTRMTSAVSLQVPLEVQVGHGRNWDAAGH